MWVIYLTVPCQPSHISFPQQLFVKTSDGKRSLQAGWFQRWKRLHYSIAQDAVCCFSCVPQWETGVCSLPDRQRRAFWSAVYRTGKTQVWILPYTRVSIFTSIVGKFFLQLMLGRCLISGVLQTVSKIGSICFICCVLYISWCTRLAITWWRWL